MLVFLDNIYILPVVTVYGSFASFYGCFVVGIIILLFSLVGYSSPVLKRNPVLNLAPPSAIVSNKLT